MRIPISSAASHVSAAEKRNAPTQMPFRRSSKRRTRDSGPLGGRPAHGAHLHVGLAQLPRGYKKGAFAVSAGAVCAAIASTTYVDPPAHITSLDHLPVGLCIAAPHALDK